MLAALSEWLFDPSGLTPHGFCLLWEPSLIWTYALSDATIALSYFSIPMALVLVVRKRRDLVFRPLLWLSAAFILLCGTTHWLDLLTLWLPMYGLLGLIKATTAIVSLACAVALWRFMPDILALPSPTQMREANAALLQSREQLFQIQKMEAVGQLTGGVAHDFNNLLQVVSGSIDILERRLAEGRQDGVARCLEAMRHATETAATLTTRMLAFSRRQALRPIASEPDCLVAGMEELIRRTIGPHIEFAVRLGDGRWNVLCDPGQLETALLNLAINSRDAMPNGGRLMLATADRTLSASDIGDASVPPGDFVEIEVADTGEGMDAATLSRVFEPFFTTKPIGEGTGLGLSQVHGFVSQSGGFIKIVSEPEAGTIVKIFLPAYERTSRAKSAATEIVATEPRRTLPTKSVLVVDDQDQVRRQIVESMEHLGWSVTEAADGPSALKILQSVDEIDFLISDVGLPGLNGRQLAESARHLFPDLPVVLLTGFSGAALDDLDADHKFTILKKPFSLEDLARLAETMLARKPAREQV